MEEGPEPQEWVEKSAEHHHHEQEHGPEHAEAERRHTMTAAVTAAVLAVCAAIGSLLSGHAANEAILNQARATDQWAYFQAKSTREHLYDVSAELVEAIAESGGTASADKTRHALDRFKGYKEKYKGEKEEIGEKARHLEHESEHELEQHKRYSFGIVAFQVGVVLASVSIMVRYRLLHLLSFLAGGVGVVYVLIGLFT